MTAFAEASAAIRSRFDSNWTTTAKVYENVPYEPVQGTSFVVLEILTANMDQISLGEAGSRRFRLRGLIYLHIHTPANIGTKLSNEYADSLAAIFRAVEFGGVLTFAPSIRDGGVSDDGNWRITRVVTEFQFDKSF